MILSAKDELADTIRPRLDAAVADPRRVFYLPSIVDLRHDLAKLRSAVERAPDCRLIIIDPINAFVGPGDSHIRPIVCRASHTLGCKTIKSSFYEGWSWSLQEACSEETELNVLAPVEQPETVPSDHPRVAYDS